MARIGSLLVSLLLTTSTFCPHLVVSFRTHHMFPWLYRFPSNDNVFGIGNVVRRSSTVATVELVEANNSGVSGNVTLQQEQYFQTVTITGVIVGLKKGFHGFHVHQTGELGNDCADALGHFNPFQQTHGAPTSTIRHVGDLGNIRTLSDNQPTQVAIYDRVISLNENSAANILGRSIVVHAEEDDLGLGGNAESLVTGNAGKRIACGVIRRV